MNVLIVDDEEFSIRLLSRQLDGLGIADIVELSNADQALNLLQDQPESIDLVFCDLQMPEMDGVELIRNMGKLQCTQTVVLVSGEDQRTLQAVEKVAHAYDINVRGVLQKPVSTAALQEVLHQAEHTWRSSTRPSARKKYVAGELLVAITQNQLVNVYQPKVSMVDGRLVGAEALVRWQHPLDGTIFPDQFIGLAETSGLIQGLTRRVLTNALNDMNEWALSDLELQVAINVSMENLSEYDFPEQVLALLSSHNIPLSQICIELTESRLASDKRLPLDILTRLRLKGFKLSLDDFGTGHSSLSHLRDLPFDELKFDRTFVDGVARDQSLAVILQSNIEMAKNLNISMVAEGVEDVADWQFLRRCGVDQAQGYLIAKPMRAEDLPVWLNEWKQRVPELLTTLE